jgi:hypothetical protein
MAKTKRSLILYQSLSGNTEKIASSFKQAFLNKGWQCDMVKVDKNLKAEHLPFKFDDYDFLCAGSGVYAGMPGKEIVDLLYQYSHQTRRDGKIIRVHRRIIPGPNMGIVFVTYAGTHLGPKEAEPSLSLLDLCIEHLRFKCVGRFSCPGGVGQNPTPGQWFGNISNRPSKRDLQKAETFMEEILEGPDLR